MFFLSKVKRKKKNLIFCASFLTYSLDASPIYLLRPTATYSTQKSIRYTSLQNVKKLCSNAGNGAFRVSLILMVSALQSFPSLCSLIQPIDAGVGGTIY